MKNPNLVLALAIATAIACNDQFTERTLTAKISLTNNCDGLFSIKPDLVDVIMRFFDGDSTPIIDADVVKLTPASDSIFQVNLRLKNSDKLQIKDIRTKHGYPYCTSMCWDTITTCKPDTGYNGLGGLHALDDTIWIKLWCNCRF